jgi:hypothetical protein
MPEVNIGAIPWSVVALGEAGSEPESNLPADTSAADSNTDLAMLQVGTGLDGFSRGFGSRNPEVMVGVGVDANVRLESCLDICDPISFDC